MKRNNRWMGPKLGIPWYTRNPLVNHNVFHYNRHVWGIPPFETHPAGWWFQILLLYISNPERDPHLINSLMR